VSVYQQFCLVMETEKVSETLVQRNVTVSLRRITFWYRTIRLVLLSISTSRLLPFRFLLSNDLFIKLCSCTIFILSFFLSYTLPNYFLFLSSPQFLILLFSLSFILWCLLVNCSLTLTFSFSTRPSLLYFPFSLSFFLRLSICYNLLLFFFLLLRVFSFLLRSKGRQIMPFSWWHVCPSPHNVGRVLMLFVFEIEIRSKQTIILGT